MSEYPVLFLSSNMMQELNVSILPIQSKIQKAKGRADTHVYLLTTLISK